MGRRRRILVDVKDIFEIIDNELNIVFTSLKDNLVQDEIDDKKVIKYGSQLNVLESVKYTVEQYVENLERG